jgi:hypothetical protein
MATITTSARPPFLPTQRLRRSARAIPLAAAVLLLCVFAARAEPPVVESIAEQRSALAVTVYNTDLGLVREVRSVDLPKGRSTLRFGDVAEQIRPETVSVMVAKGPAVRILEQNYEYDLLSPEKILDKYVGREVTVYVTNEETGEERPVTATLLSNNQGRVFRIGDEISLGLAGRVVVPDVPENLIARPTLLWQLEASGRGERQLDVSYLTRGLGWQADYVAALSADEKTADLTGWVTVDNRSGAMFEKATLKLVAGDVNLVTEPMFRPQPRTMALAMAAEQAPNFEEREFFEYHLYALERPTTLKQNQKKQIELLAADDVPVRKRYIAQSGVQLHDGQTPDDKPKKVDVKLELDNDTASHLGRPLPKGIVRVYKRDTDETLTFAGEDAIDHTPEGETVRLKLGQAFDVTYERRVTSFMEVSKREVELSIEIMVQNQTDEAIAVTVVERFPQQRRLLGSSIKPREPDAFTLEFDVEVPAKSKSTISYEARAKR